MTIRRCTGLSGADDRSTLRCFEVTGRPQSLAVTDDDTGSLLATSLSPRGNTEPVNDAKPRSSSSFVVMEQHLRPVVVIIFSLLPSLAIVAAFSSWTYTSAQVERMATILKFNTYMYINKKAMLSQGEPRDAAVNFGTHIEVYSRKAQFLLR